MPQESAFTKALVPIRWDNDPMPVLRCPITGKVIVAGYDPAIGEVDEGILHPEWKDVPTVLFHCIPEVGQFDYITPELQAKIDQKREELSEEAEDLDDFDILEEHVESLGKVPLVFLLIDPVGTQLYVGLDLAA